MSVLVLIVNHNCWELTVTATRSILSHCAGPVHFAIADNGSCDESPLLDEHCPGEHTVVRIENKGFAHAVNALLEKLQPPASQLLLIVNPDTYCSSDFISPMVRALSDHPEAAAVSPTILTPDNQVWYAGGTISFLKGGPRHSTARKTGKPMQVEFVTGCALMTTVAAYQEAGGFPDRYFLYFEDVHLSLAWSQNEKVLLMAPEAILSHHVSATTDSMSPLYAYLFARNRIWLMRSFASPSKLIVFLALHFCVRLPLAMLFYGSKGKFRHLQAFLFGLLDGVQTDDGNQRTLRFLK